MTANLAYFLSPFQGDEGTGGTEGLVPAPPVGSGAASEFLKADGTWAVPSGTGGGVTSVGTYDSQTAAAKGLVIVGTTIYAQSATASLPGMVNAAAQTFTGVKTFASAIVAPGANFSGLTASEAVVTDSSKNLASVAYSMTATASSFVQRDANGNLFAVNCVSGLTVIVSAAATVTMTAASTRVQEITGTTTEIFTLPDATTLTNGWVFEFDNNSTGVVTVNNKSSTLITTVQPGAYIQVICISNATTAGTWDYHSIMPSTAVYGTAGLTVTGAITATTKMTCATFQLTTTPTSGYVLTSDGSGNATWQASASAVSSITGTANQITASASTGAITLSMPTSVGLGSSNSVQASTALTVNTTYTNGICLAGTQAVGGTTLYGMQFLNIMSPANTYDAYGLSVTPIINAPSGGLSSASSIVIETIIDGSATTAEAIGIEVGPIGGTGPITLSAGGYFNNPARGTIQMALYADNLSVGVTTINLAGTNNLLVAGTTSTTQLQVTNGATNNYILKSDASGNATWAALSSIGISSVSGTAAQVTAVTTSGAVVLSLPTSMGIGASNSVVASTSVTLNAAGTNGLYIQGTLSTASAILSALSINTTLTPSATETAYIINNTPSITSPSGGLTNVMGSYTKLTLTGSGTVTNIYGHYVDVPSVVGTTVGTAYGGFFATPTTGTTNNIALRADSIAVGVTGDILTGTNNLSVAGKTITSTFKLVTGATNNYIMVSDASGNGTWQSVSSIGIASVSGTTNQITAVTTSGAVVLNFPTSVGIGASNAIVANTSITVNAAGTAAINIQGTLTTAGTALYGIINSPTLTPGAGQGAYVSYIAPTVTVPAGTLPSAIGEFITVAFNGTGTLTNSFGIFVGAATMTGGATNTLAYGGYFTAPTIGTFNNTALYADNISIGNTSSILTGTHNLAVQGKTITNTFQLTTGAANDYVLVSDASGNGTWQNFSVGGIISVTGTANQITAVDTSGNVVLSFPTAMGIGASNAVLANASVTVNCATNYGMYFQGSLTTGGNSQFGVLLNTSMSPATGFSAYGISSQPTAVCGAGGLAKVLGLYGQLTTSGTGTITAAACVFGDIILNSGPTITTAYGGYFVTSTSGSANIALYADNFVVGVGYNAIAPPTSGMMVEGQVGIGTHIITAGAEMTLTANTPSAIAYGMYMVGIFGLANSNHIGIQVQTVFTPTATYSAYGISSATVVAVPSGGLATVCAFYANVALSTLSGTVTTAYGFFFNTMTTSGAAITSAFGAYISAPTIASTTNIALYADNLVIGSAYTTTNPPAGGLICEGYAYFGETGPFGGEAFGINLDGVTGRYGVAITGNQASSSTADPNSSFFIGNNYLPTVNIVDYRQLEITMAISPANTSTVTNAVSLYINPGSQGGAGTVTRGYGLVVSTPTFGSTNINSWFKGAIVIGSGNGGLAGPTNGILCQGFVGIGGSPTAPLSVVGSLSVNQISAINITATLSNNTNTTVLAAFLNTPIISNGAAGSTHYGFDNAPNFSSSSGALTNAYASYFGSTVSGGTVTNLWNLYVPAPTGAVNNYCAAFMGNVSIYTATSIFPLELGGSAALNVAAVIYNSTTLSNNTNSVNLVGLWNTPTFTSGNNGSIHYGLLNAPTVNGGATSIGTFYASNFSMTIGTGTYTNVYGVYVANPSGLTSSVTSFVGLYVAAPTGATSNVSSVIMGDALFGTTTVDTAAVGGVLQISYTGSYLLDLNGAQTAVDGGGSNTIGLRINNSIQVAGGSTNGYGIYVSTSLNPPSAQTIVNGYGAFIAPIKGGSGVLTNLTGLYVANPSGGSVGNYCAALMGYVGILTATPAYPLHIAGSTAVNVASSLFLNTTLSNNTNAVNLVGLYNAPIFTSNASGSTHYGMLNVPAITATSSVSEFCSQYNAGSINSGTVQYMYNLIVAQPTGASVANICASFAGGINIGASIVSNTPLTNGVLAQNGFWVPNGVQFTGSSPAMDFFSTYGSYRIGFDNLGGSVGYMRYNVLGNGTTIFGHMFSNSTAAGGNGPYTNCLFMGADQRAQFFLNTTGGGTALLSTNCPAATPSAPYTWWSLRSADGSIVYIPVWK